MTAGRTVRVIMDGVPTDIPLGPPPGPWRRRLRAARARAWNHVRYGSAEGPRVIVHRDGRITIERASARLAARLAGWLEVER